MAFGIWHLALSIWHLVLQSKDQLHAREALRLYPLSSTHNGRQPRKSKKSVSVLFSSTSTSRFTRSSSAVFNLCSASGRHSQYGTVSVSVPVACRHSNIFVHRAFIKSWNFRVFSMSGDDASSCSNFERCTNSWSNFSLAVRARPKPFSKRVCMGTSVIF